MTDLPSEMATAARAPAASPPLADRQPRAGCDDRAHPSRFRSHHGRNRQDLRRPGRARARHAGGAVFQRPRADRKRAGAGQDAVRPRAGPRAGLPVRPHSVHGRPDALGHHRRADLRHEAAGVSLPPGPGLHAVSAGRRNQSLAGQDARGPAGDHAGVSRHGRAHQPQARSGRSWCWPRRTRSSPKAPTTCPRRSSIASCSRSWPTIPSADEEVAILEAARPAGRSRPAAGRRRCRPSPRPRRSSTSRQQCGQVHIDDKLFDYINTLVRLTRAVAAVSPGRLAAGRHRAGARRPHAGRLSRPRLRRARRRGRDRPARPAASRDSARPRPRSKGHSVDELLRELIRSVEVPRL